MSLIIGFANTLNETHTDFVHRSLVAEAERMGVHADVDRCDKAGEHSIIVHAHDPHLMQHLVKIGLLSTFMIDDEMTEGNFDRLRELYKGTNFTVECVDEYEGKCMTRVHAGNVQYSSNTVMAIYYVVQQLAHKVT